MAEMTMVKCKNCTAPLDITKAEKGVIRCDYCGEYFTVPKKDASPAALDFLRTGEHELDSGAFERAYTAYAKAAEYDSDEPEAYFGMAMSTFKVQRIKDGVNNRLQAVCNEISDKQFAQNANYLKALEFATPEQRVQYENLAKEIDYIRKEFLKLSSSGLNFDCFICVKVTDNATNGRTADYKTADDIYFHLRGKGFNPFFSERVLDGRTGDDYEALILYALRSAECMIVVCSNEEYLQTPWVKNEYTRFLRLMGDDLKESDSIALVFDGKPIERLPGREGKLQGIDLRSPDAFGKITSFVENHTPAARTKREVAAAKKKEEEEAQAKRLSELEKKLEKLSYGSSASPFSPKPYVSRDSDFEVKNGKLIKYKGKAADVVIPSGITQIGKNAFKGNGTIVSATVPDGVTVICESAFFDCPALAHVKIPASVAVIEQCAFSFCDSMREAEISDANEHYKSDGNCIIERQTNTVVAAFNDSVIPYYATAIGDWAFNGCGRLTNIGIPPSVVKIGNSAFNRCTSLTSFVLPSGVAQIGEGIFKSCYALTDITVADGNPAYMSEGNCLIETESATLIAGCGASVIPAVTKIADGAFECSSIEEAILPDGVTVIGANAFYGCSSLKKVVLPNSVEQIGEEAFRYCDNATIYCTARKKPKTWRADWNMCSRDKACATVFKYKLR